MSSTRATWKGSLTFGLVNVPVEFYVAQEEHRPKFNQLCAEHGTRIKLKKVCSLHGEELTSDHIARAYAVDRDEYVTITDDELEGFGPAASRAIEVDRFVDPGSIPPAMFRGKSYFLTPDEVSIKAYRLIAAALERTGRVGLVTWTMRGTRYLGTLRPVEGAFEIESLYWPDELRASTVELPGDELKDEELALAVQLIEALAGDFEPARYHDDTSENVLALIEQKAAGLPVTTTPVESKPSPVENLMEVLRASVAAAEGQRPAAPKKSAKQAKQKVA